MLTVFYSPHATSVDNEAGRASGHADVPLSPVGKREAEERGRQYAATRLDAVFCSDLQRAATTGRIAFSARGLPLFLDARLREYDYGDLTQFPREQVETEFARRIREPFPNGESLVMVTLRVGAFLREMRAQYAGKTIAIIGHRATRYGLEYWSGDASLEEIVRAPWEWLEVPIWRYEIDESHLVQRSFHLENQ
jgi:broad specificity phosphatase PhoE